MNGTVERNSPSYVDFLKAQGLQIRTLAIGVALVTIGCRLGSTADASAGILLFTACLGFVLAAHGESVKRFFRATLTPVDAFLRRRTELHRTLGCPTFKSHFRALSDILREHPVVFGKAVFSLFLAAATPWIMVLAALLLSSMALAVASAA